ncbi:hypothetical protein HNQ51_001214 [Inhella inkyongensis]|uniref:SMODS and SLOG-associating 2TM effector domain-containing protein n=1 Tax=Inhella inkyongensis TaxID=392593 RepID=A0A840S5L7_9BURK|nr:DUF4231 domain-containing protein [Inhella inkyongensis]MBB5203921.1 hypothetical protein [Inhella inkyongensis]
MSAFEQLLNTVAGEVAHFDREAARHRDQYRRGQTILILCSAAASIVSGLGLLLGSQQGPLLQFVVLCLTTTTAGLGAWLEMRRARELWQHERALHHGLQDLEREMHFRAAQGEPAPAQLEQWFERLQQLLGSGSERWARIVERPEKR